MAAEHTDTDAFRGATFRTADMRGASFHTVDLSGARFHNVDLSGATFRDSDLSGVWIVASLVADLRVSAHEDGGSRVVVDDVDVTDFVAAELDRRHPERVHADRRARVRRLVATVTDAELAQSRTAVPTPVWGEESHPVGECLRVLLAEHCAHRRYAERDLARLAAR
jgi:hypothetical protein